MKKKKNRLAILAAVLCAVCLSGFTYSNKEGGNIPTDSEQMRILHFHGHRYVCYRFYEKERHFMGANDHTAIGGASITHDPDCPCHKRD